MKKLGKTGKYPKGELNEHDEGALTYAVGLVDGKIFIDFGSPVAWLGLDLESATALKKALQTHIKELLTKELS
jgi:hypothetical protein